MSFDDMTKRILDKLDKLDVAIDELCGRVMKVEMQLKSHFRDIENKQKSKDRKFYIIICIMGVIFTIVQIIQSK